jgi:vacuolar-type H+-ATPase subunit I/STV1
MGEISTETLQATMAKANELAKTMQPLGGSLAILELRPVFEAMKVSVEDQARALTAVKQEVQALVSYKAALQTFIAGLEQRAHELAEGIGPEERRQQQRLSELEARIAQLDEQRRQCERVAQLSLDAASAYVRRLRGGQL